MRVQIAGTESTPERVFKLRLVQNGDHVSVEDAESGYSLVGFDIVDKKLQLTRYRSVGDSNIRTDSKGHIAVSDEL